MPKPDEKPSDQKAGEKDGKGDQRDKPDEGKPTPHPPSPSAPKGGEGIDITEKSVERIGFVRIFYAHNLLPFAKASDRRSWFGVGHKVVLVT
jgi:hypothetical protein